MIIKSVFDKRILKKAIWKSFLKLNPVTMIKSPVMFVVLLSVFWGTVVFFVDLPHLSIKEIIFESSLLFWLWGTIIFANFAEAIAEGITTARAKSLRRKKINIRAKRLIHLKNRKKYEVVDAIDLNVDDLVLVEAGDIIPGDGVVIDGIASVNESAITGESAPVIRESGSNRNIVTIGTKIISDWLVIKITSGYEDSFLDKMTQLVETSQRQKTANEMALNDFLIMLTVIFFSLVVALPTFWHYGNIVSGISVKLPFVFLVSIFVCFAPITIAGLSSAIGIAGMNRMIKNNVLVFSNSAIETSGNIDTLLLDKTGTITMGNRQAAEFIAADGVSIAEMAKIALLSSLIDETPEGKSIVELAYKKYGVKKVDLDDLKATFIPFSAQTRMSGINFAKTAIRKGSVEVIKEYLKNFSTSLDQHLEYKAEFIAKKGETPLLVTLNEKVMGIIRLKDVIKPGLKEKFKMMHRLGIKTIMLTGDNYFTTASIAAEAGIDDFIAQADPESKLNLIKKLQNEGHIVAMTGDGSNDSPSLAQADIGIAMSTGTQDAKEAANMIDLDSDPTKVVDVVETGKQLLMTRGALTSFSLLNDLAKYFTILPAIFGVIYPQLDKLNFLHLYSHQSAILSTVIYNAISIVILIPVALKGVYLNRATVNKLLSINTLTYSLFGFFIPFLAIKLLDMFLVAMNIV